MVSFWKWLRYLVFLSLLFPKIAGISRKETESKANNDNTSTIYDLDSAIRQYIEKMVFQFQENKAAFQKENSTIPSFKTKDITVGFGAMQYGKPMKSSMKATYVYTHWFHNSEDIAMNSGLRQKSIACAGIFTWTVQRGVKLEGHDITVRADIPGIFKNMADFGINLSKTGAQSSSQPLRTSFSAHKFYMRPKTSSKVEFRIPVRVIQMRWKVFVFLDGWFTVYMAKNLRGTKIWKYPVWWITNKSLVVVKDGNNHRLAFVARGRLAAIWFPDLQEIHSPELAYQPHQSDSFLLYRDNRTQPENDPMDLCVLQ